MLLHKHERTDCRHSGTSKSFEQDDNVAAVLAVHAHTRRDCMNVWK